MQVNKKHVISLSVICVLTISVAVIYFVLANQSPGSQLPEGSQSSDTSARSTASPGNTQLGFGNVVSKARTLVVQNPFKVLFSALSVVLLVAFIVVLVKLPKSPSIIAPVKPEPPALFSDFEQYALLAMLAVVIVGGLIASWVYRDYILPDIPPDYNYDQELADIRDEAAPNVSILPKDRAAARNPTEPRTRARAAGAHPEAFSGISDPVKSGLHVMATIKLDSLQNPLIRKATDPLPDVKDRFVGAMVGLAVGDAYGAPYEFKPSRAIKRLNLKGKNIHTGRFSKRIGAWTDDTAMALCLLASAIEKGKFDVADVFVKYKKWYSSQYMNFDGTKTDFGTTTENTLDKNTIDVKTQPSWGNGVIMRLAPVVMQYLHSDVEAALIVAAASGGMTAGDQGALDFPALLAYILRGFIKGTLSRVTVCKPDFIETHLGWYFDKHPYGKNMATLVAVWPKPVKCTGSTEQFSSHIVLSRAIYSFCTTPDLESGLAKVVSFGYDTDTAAAIFGQLYGAYYGIANEGVRGPTKDLGLSHYQVYSTTERIDCITELSEVLWGMINNDPVVSTLVNEGVVTDINPKFIITGKKNVDGISIVPLPAN